MERCNILRLFSGRRSNVKRQTIPSSNPSLAIIKPFRPAGRHYKYPAFPVTTTTLTQQLRRLIMAANTLASELARVQNIVRELEANMGHHQDLPPAAWAICGELASRVDRSLRIARSWSESPAGCPDGDGAGANAAHSKRRQVDDPPFISCGAGS
jgi:hypothetical protein